MQDEDTTVLRIVPIDHATGWLNELSIRPASKLPGNGTAVRMPFQLIDVREHATHELLGSGGIFERDVIRDSVQIGQRGFRPNYLSHRAILAFA